MTTMLRSSMPALIFALGILGLLGFESLRSYHAIQRDAERNVGNLVQVLSEQTARTIQAIDLALQDMVAQVADPSKLSDNDVPFRVELRRRLKSLPYARSLFVVDAGGLISHDTDYPDTPRVSLADRPYFIAHRDDATIGLRIGTPLRSRSLGSQFVAITRRIERADGSFAGIAVAAMDPLYFERAYRRLWIGSGTIALFRNDGTLLARSPAAESMVGTSFADRRPFNALLGPDIRGVFWGESPIDNVERVGGYRAVENAPFVMLVTVDKDEVMRPWRAHVTVTSVGALILIMMLAGLEVMARRHRFREEQARERLAEAERLESVGRFTAGVAHDVGNLLRIVRSAVVLLRPRVTDRPAAGRLLDQIDATLAVGKDLVAQLMSYARTGDRKPQVSNLNDLVFEALPMLRQAAGPRVELHGAFAASAVACRVDRPRFHAVLLNLILNARDSMPDGGAISLAVRLVPGLENGRSGWGEISVSDDGAGMPKAILKQALDPFFTTKQPGQGSGLGLSQVRSFAEGAQGELQIDSEEGRGTTIRLRLPLAQKDEAAQEAAA